MLCKDGMYDDSKQWEDYVLPGAFVCFVTVLQYNSEWDIIRHEKSCTITSYQIIYSKHFQFDTVHTIYWFIIHCVQMT